MDLTSLFETIEEHIKSEKDLEQVLLLCLDEEENSSLDYITKLTELDYHAPLSPFAYTACVLAMTCWGKGGLSYLSKFIPFSEEYHLRTSYLEILAYMASTPPNKELAIPIIDFNYPLLLAKVNGIRKNSSEDLIPFTRNILIESIIDQNDANFLSMIQPLFTLGFSITLESCKLAFNTLLSAYSNKWLRISKKGLNEYQTLIQKSPITEEEVHSYIYKNPYLLDPFYTYVWSKEPLGEKLEADFITRLIDDTYIVIEIEKPTDPIMNKKGDLSYQTTHAIRQALEYRDWLVYNHLYAKQRFENIKNPICLAVIGLEQNLNNVQKALLRTYNENHSVKIVGFDLLSQRAQKVLDNFIKHGFERFE